MVLLIRKPYESTKTYAFSQFKEDNRFFQIFIVPQASCMLKNSTGYYIKKSKLNNL